MTLILVVFCQSGGKGEVYEYDDLIMLDGTDDSLLSGALQWSLAKLFEIQETFTEGMKGCVFW